MEIVRISFERNLCERTRGIKPIAGMKLREVCAEHVILKCGENLIADPFVKRHSAPASGALVDHARTENGVRLAAHEWVEQLRQLFRRVLTIAMNQRDNIETMIDGVAIAKFLVATVTLIFRRTQNRDFEFGITLLVTHAFRKRIVL